MLTAEFKVFLYFSNEVRLALKQTGGVRGVQKGEETLRQTSALHCTESSAEAVEELQPARYLPSDFSLASATSSCPCLLPGCFLPIGKNTTRCCRSHWGFTTLRSSRGNSDSPAEGSSQLAVMCAMLWTRRAAPQAEDELCSSSSLSGLL